MASSEVSSRVNVRERANSLFFWPVLILPLLLFFGAGLLLIPQAGFEVDEVMFVNALWHPTAYPAWLSVKGHHLPSMLMSYLGALKSWIFAPVLFTFGINEWTVRVPALLLATVTILIGALLLRRIGSRLAACAFGWLLATDVTFLVTATFDWGPVVIQNLLLIAIIFVFEKWWWERRERLLFIGALLVGMALWDKALFIWNLSSMSVALVLLNGPAVLRQFAWKRAAIALAGLLLGAYPLIRFNVHTRSATFSENTHIKLQDVPPKAAYLKYSLNGLVAQGGFSNFRYSRPQASQSKLDLFVLTVVHPKGEGVSSWRLWLLVIACTAGLIASDRIRRKWILFFLISAILSWLQSALTVNAGGSIHHNVLVWPLLYAALALSLHAVATLRSADALSRTSRIAAIAVLVIFSARGLQTIAICYSNFIFYSRESRWTEADKTLASYLAHKGVTRVVVTDWGIADSLATRSQEKISVTDEFFELNAGKFDKGGFLSCTAPACLIVGHTKDAWIGTAAFDSFENFSKANAFVKTDEELVRDSAGTPIYTLFRLRATQ